MFNFSLRSALIQPSYSLLNFGADARKPPLPLLISSASSAHGREHEAALGQGAVDAERARVLVPDAAFGLRVEVRAEPPKAVLPKDRIHISLFGPFSEMSIPIAAIN